MKRFFSYILAVFVLFNVTCESVFQDAATKEYLKQYTDQKEPLAIDYYTPQGLTEVIQNKVVIHFNQPMVALSAVGGLEQDGLVVITPKLDGYYKWVNSKTLVFQTKGDLPFATDYKVTVKAGRESLLGFMLIKDFEFAFHTPAPAVTSTQPKDGHDQLELHGTISLTFNQPLKPKDVAAFIQVKAGGAGPVPVDVSCPKKTDQKEAPQTCETMHVRPAEPLGRDTAVNVTVLKGIKSLEGPRLSEAESIFSFKTIGAFNITEVHCQENICEQNGSLIIKATTPIDEESFKKHVKITPAARETGGSYAYWSNYEKRLVYYPTLKPFTDYKITITKGLQDIFKQELQKPFEYRFKTGHARASFNFPYVKEQVVDYKDTLDLGFTATNILSAKATFKSGLSNAEIIGLYTDHQAVIRGLDDAGSWDFVKDFQGEINDKKVFYSVPHTEIEGLGESAIILSRYVSPEVTAYDDDGVTRKPEEYWLLKQVTDLAIDVKQSVTDGLIWVSSLKTGENIPAVAFEIYNSRGQRLYSGVTDAQGTARIPGRDELKTRSKGLDSAAKKNAGVPFYFFAKKDSDRAYIHTDWIDGLGGYAYFDDYEWGEEGDASAAETGLKEKQGIKNIQQVRVHLLTDRGLYKPGEAVEIKGYLREVTDKGLKVFTKPVVLKIAEPRNSKPFVINVTPNARGNFTARYHIPPKAPLGYHSIDLESEDSSIKLAFGHSGFQTEEFRTPEFKVDVTLPQKKIIQGDPLEINIASNYLFGAPMKGAGVRYYITKNVGDFAPTNDQDWQFGKIYDADTIDDVLLLETNKDETATLDEQGRLLITQNTGTEIAQPVRFGVDAMVSDLGGQTVTGYSEILLHPASYYIGAKLQKMFYNVGEDVSVAFAALDAEGQYLLDKPVSVELMRVKWVSVKREVIDGQFETETQKKEERVDICEKKTLKANTCTFKPTESGYYYFKLTAKDEKGRLALTEIPLYCSGLDYAYWPSETGHEIELVKDKKKYNKGDVARVIVKSPYQNANAIISIERENILSYEFKKLSGSTPVIEVPIREEHAPNIFVNVVLVRGALQIDPSHGAENAVTEDALVKSGRVELVVEPYQKNLAMEIKPAQKTYRPGDTAEVEFAVTGVTDNAEAEVTVMVVDEGVLMAGAYHLQNPLDTFFAPYYNNVGQFDARTRYVGRQGLEEKLESPASGGGREGGFRKKFIPLAYYNGELVTQNGRAKVTFTVPDQLTTFKIMGVVNANVDKFGLGFSEIKTQKDLMIRPALPRFIRVSDQIQSEVVLHNNTEKEMEAHVVTTANNLEVVAGGDQKIKVPPKSAVSYLVGLKTPVAELTRQMDAKLKAGEVDTKINAVVSFVAEAAGADDRVEIAVPVFHERAVETVATSGVSTGEVSEFVEKGADIDENYGNLRVDISANLLSKLRAQVAQLRIYPFDCLEQRLGKIYPFVLFPDRDDLFQGRDREAAFRFETVRDFIQHIRQQQDYYGEFSYWPGGRATPALTLMTAEFLIAAGQAGHDVREPLDKISERLYVYLAGEHFSLKEYSPEFLLRLKINTLYVFYLLENPQYVYYDGLKPDYEGMDLVTRARFIEMLAGHDPADPLVKDWQDAIEKDLRIKGSTAYFDPVVGEYYFGETARTTTARIFQGLLRVNPSHPFIFQILNYLVTQKSASDYYSSLELLNTLKVLKVFQSKYASLDAQRFSARILMNDKEVARSELTEKRPEDYLDVPMDKLPQKLRLKIINEGSRASLFYDIRYNYALKDYRPYGVEQGISISREYADLDGNAVEPSKIKHGETYRVTLHFYFADEVDYLAVEETLPAGMEPVNFNINTSKFRFDERPKGGQRDLSWYSSYSEFRDQKVVLFVNYAPRGFFDFSYYAHVTNRGSYLVPPARAVEMYHPEVYGTTAKEVVEVK
ncbi:MAG: Ig-like domain-containing protein [Deltaproteobacteria bacterium]|nr:Ig-like domain-containing protein [Deltaproteobacteria bacterium]